MSSATGGRRNDCPQLLIYKIRAFLVCLLLNGAVSNQNAYCEEWLDSSEKRTGSDMDIL